MRREFLMVGGVTLLAACGGGSSAAPNPPGGSNPPVSTTSVDVNDNFFSPGGVAAATQASLTWTWKGSSAHNVTFEDGQGSSTTKAGGTHVRAFTASGTFRYRCTIHSSNFTSGMVGSVVVN